MLPLLTYDIIYLKQLSALQLHQKQMKTLISLLLLIHITLSFQMQSPSTRLHLSPSTSSPNGCGNEAVIAKNFFTVCTQQATTDDIEAVSGCIQAALNNYYSGQKWQSAILQSSSTYSIWASAVNECLVQQKPYSSSQWDYYAWRVQ